MSIAGSQAPAVVERTPALTLKAERCVAICVVLVAAGLCPACTAVDRDISRLPPYSKFVGHTYRIVGDVDASKVIEYAPTGSPEFIMLHPRSRRPSGPEIAFTRPLSRGQAFKIIGARIFDTPIDDTTYYLIELFDDPFQTSVEVRIRFERDNGSLADGTLNPSYYERVE